MAELTFKVLTKGINTNEDLAYGGALRRVEGIDIHGVGAGTFADCPHRPGVYMPSQEMVAETLGTVSAGNEVSAMVEWIQPYGTKTFGVTNNGNIVVTESVPQTDTQQTWYRVSAISATTGGGGLLPFGTKLYYGQDAVLGCTDGTATDNNNQVFKENSTTPRPSVIFGGKSFWGNGRYIASLNSDEVTWDDDALTLPIGFVIRSMDVWNNYIAIAADFIPSGATNSTMSKLFLWDGLNPTYENALKLPFSNAPLLAAYDNLLWMFGDDGALNGTVYIFNGAELKNIYFLPDTVFHKIGSRTKFQTSLLVGTNGRTTADNGGIFSIGKESGSSNYGPYLSHLKSGGSKVSAVNVGGLYAESNNILAGWQDAATTYGIDRSDNDQFPDSGGLIQTLPLHLGTPEKKKSFTSLKLDLETAGTATGSTFQVLYRIDSSTDAFTALKTLAITDDLNMLLPIRKIGRRIEFQFKWVTTANAPIRLRSFTIIYSALEKTN